MRRHRAAVAASAVLAAALGAGAAGVVWQGIRAQESRRVAENRFRDSLKLTSSLLSDFYGAVEKLDGSGPAQQSLLRWSRETLDALARQSGGNPVFQADVAESYWRLGNLQAAGCCKYPDQAADSLAAFDSGLALLEPALRRGGAGRQAHATAARLLEARSRIEAMLGHTDEARHDAAEARRVLATE